MTFAIVLWVLTVIFFVGTLLFLTKRKKGMSILMGLITLGLGVVAYGLTDEIISSKELEKRNKEFLEKEVLALNKSVQAVTTADKTRYANINKIISEHMKDSQQPLVCDPAVSKNNLAAVKSRIQKDIIKFMDQEFYDSEEIAIENVLYLSCVEDSVGFNEIMVLGSDYQESAEDYIGSRVSLIEGLLELTPQDLSPGSEWFESNKGDYSQNLCRPQEYLEHFTQMMRDYRYLALVHLEYVLKPQSGDATSPIETSFESGFGCSRVDVYDIDTGSLKESFRVYFTNSDKITHFSSKDDSGTEDDNGYLWGNLLNNMKKSVIKGLSLRGYPLHLIKS